MKTQDLKLVVGASAGGHVNELLILLEAARGLWPVEPAAYVTTMEIAVKGFSAHGKPVHVLGEGDRLKPLRSIGVLLRALRSAWVLRPGVVVTTGSMPLALFCFWSRLFGARIVWIDSVAQVEKMSLSGRFVRRFADLCLVQWPEVAASTPETEYAGELF
ncbi:MAG: UDP-N-acetylglucosamine transferase subunit ALG14 [Burkholderiaceae bacterium]|jgi:hypothetical protein|nr:UDP-N-acetylglucosamine transferase subunit ALG14 [Burkholderiaceae bacterium]MCU0963715.1 UDP-N-acetylglucosamine transferase subunit ALG14 [Burkholderiaceae bacterium]